MEITKEALRNMRVRYGHECPLCGAVMSLQDSKYSTFACTAHKGSGMEYLDHYSASSVSLPYDLQIRGDVMSLINAYEKLLTEMNTLKTVFSSQEQLLLKLCMERDEILDAMPAAGPDIPDAPGLWWWMRSYGPPHNRKWKPREVSLSLTVCDEESMFERQHVSDTGGEWGGRCVEPVERREAK